jgi:hypothetical protein
MFASISKVFSQAAAVLLFASMPLQAGVLIDITDGTPATCGSCGTAGTTFGYQFQLTNSYTIDGLGVWDEGANGLGDTAMTGLWNSAGTLLASALVTDASDVVASAITSGRWLVEDIATLTLGPGTYRIGTLFHASTPIARTNATPITAAGLTVLGGMQSTLNTGFSLPNQVFGLTIYGPTLREATAAVPLPSGLLLGALGLAALVGVRRQRYQA